MSFEYDLVEGVSEEEFRQKVKSVNELKSDNDYRLASQDELQKVETILDVQKGTLNQVKFFVEKANCQKCDAELGMNDVVKTTIEDAGHSKSAILHTLVGSKYIVDRPKNIHCAHCSEVQEIAGSYASALYGCQSNLA